MQYSVSRVEKTIGVFIFAVIVIVAAFFLFNLRTNKIFRNQITFNTLINKGYGFSNGAIVKVNGIVAGLVEEIKVEKDNTIHLVISVNHPYYENIRRDSIVEIIEPAILGSAEINILPGSTGSPEVKTGDYLVSQVSLSFATKVGESLDHLDAAILNISKTLEEVHKVSENLNSITAKADKGEGSLGRFINDPGLYNSAQRAVDSLLTLEKSLPELEATIKETHETMDNVKKSSENIESITRKIDRGDGSLGKLLNDPALYDTARDTVESTRSIVESIKSTQIFVGMDDNYYYHQNLNIAKLHLKVVPRDTRYFLIGGAVLNPSADSNISTSSTDDTNYKLVTEFIVAQKVFDNRITFRFGLLEGKIGGGIDYSPRPLTAERRKLDIRAKEVFQFTLEGRDTYDDNRFNENLDRVLLRAKARSNFSKYFHVELGSNDLLNKPGFFFGVGFEYLDEDISKIVGLIGAGK